MNNLAQMIKFSISNCLQKKTCSNCVICKFKIVGNK